MVFLAKQHMRMSLVGFNATPQRSRGKGFDRFAVPSKNERWYYKDSQRSRRVHQLPAIERRGWSAGSVGGHVSYDCSRPSQSGWRGH